MRSPIIRRIITPIAILFRVGKDEVRMYDTPNTIRITLIICCKRWLQCVLVISLILDGGKGINTVIIPRINRLRLANSVSNPKEAAIIPLPKMTSRVIMNFSFMLISFNMWGL